MSRALSVESLRRVLSIRVFQCKTLLFLFGIIVLAVAQPSVAKPSVAKPSVAKPSIAKTQESAGHEPAANENDPRIALAARAAAEFIATPTLADINQQYETWLAGQSYTSVIQAYKLFDRISLREPDAQDCAREKRAITTQIASNPFALAPTVLALKCAEIAGESKRAAQLETRIQVRLSMLLAQGRGQLLATPAMLMSWWDIPAFADVSGLQWRSTSYSGAVNVGALSAYTIFDFEPESAQVALSPQETSKPINSAKRRQSSYYFDFFGEKFRAGLSALDYETPWQRLSTIQEFMKDLAAADNVGAKIYLQEYAITTDDNVPKALSTLREMLKQPESAIQAAVSLVQIAAASKQIKLVESDLYPLIDAAEAKDFQAILALAMERTFGLVDPPDLKEAELLLKAAQKNSSGASAAAILNLMCIQRWVPQPAFALRALQTEVDQRQPSAIVTAYMFATAFKPLPEGGAWLSRFIEDKDRFAALNGAARAVVFTKLAAMKSATSQMACEAAEFGISQAKLECLQYLKSSDQRLSYLIDSAGEEDPRTQNGHKIGAASLQVAEHFEFLATPPDLVRAAKWAFSGIAFGNSKGYMDLARLALRGATPKDFDWDLVRRLFAKQPGLDRGEQTALELAFGGSDARPRLFAELKTKCGAANAAACAVWADALDLKVPDSQPLGSRLAALKLCVRAKDHQKTTLCGQYLGMSYVYGNGVKKDVARGLAYLEQLERPAIATINTIAWVRCTAPAPPLYAPEKATKYWPQLIAAKPPAFQDTLAACYAASGMFELAAGMLEKIVADLPDGVAIKTDSGNANAFKQLLQQHLKSFVDRKRWLEMDTVD